MASAPRVRVLGSRHSFSDIADSTELVSLAALPADVVVDRAVGTVSFGAGMTYGDLAGVLWHEGLALHNMASLPHISVAGAVATATHGSGDASGNLATAVAGLEIVTSGGEILTASVNCTPQLGRPGPWSDRMSHFRVGFTPSSGEELQSEFLVPREHAVAAIQAMQSLSDRIRPVLQVCEIRTVAADRLWMSPQYERDTIGIHFTWMPEPDAVARVLADVEAALAAFQARPHWGKLFLAGAATLAALYERVPDFIGLIERLDPRGAFGNRWLEARVLGAE